MKVELNIDKKFEETIVTISANKVNDEIQNLVNYIEIKEDYFIGVSDGKVRLLNLEDIIRVYVENRKVYVVTVEGRFIVRKKLYEVQSMLTKDFIKISQSEIANIKYICKCQFKYVKKIQNKNVHFIHLPFGKNL